MGIFVSVNINRELCAEGCEACLEACPMKIFQKSAGGIASGYDQEDECTFCNVCVEQCARGAITIVKNY